MPKLKQTNRAPDRQPNLFDNFYKLNHQLKEVSVEAREIHINTSISC